MDLTGRILGRYRLIGRVARGGMADVYKARQESLDRTIALKILPSTLRQDDTFQARFEQEARAIAHLNHPNILKVFDYGEVDGLAYIAMEYTPGGTLQDRMRSPMSLQEAIEIACHLGNALDYAHRHGVVHRDVKPSNVLLTDEGWPLLSDFGLVKIAQGSRGITRPSASIGTPEYMSPEQGQGQPVDHRTDIYALGALLYEMVTGQPPYTADSPVGLILKHATEPLPSPRLKRPDLPVGIESVIVKALAKAPNDRYASAGEMVDALQEAWLQARAEFPALRQEVRSERRTTPLGIRAPGRSRPRHRKAIWLALLALAVMLLAGGLTLAWRLFSWWGWDTVQSAASTANLPARVGLATPTFTVLPRLTDSSSLATMATATPTHTPTVAPTRTPTVIPIQTPFPTATTTPTAPPTMTPALPRAVALVSASLFKGPSGQTEELYIIGLGESVEIMGRSDEWHYGRWLYVLTQDGGEGFVDAPRFEYTVDWDALSVVEVDHSKLVLVSTPVASHIAPLVVVPGPLKIEYVWPASVCDKQGNWTAIFLVKISGGDGKNYNLYWDEEPMSYTVKVEERDVVVLQRPGPAGRLVGTVWVESGGQRAGMGTSVRKSCSNE